MAFWENVAVKRGAAVDTVSNLKAKDNKEANYEGFSTPDIKTMPIKNRGDVGNHVQMGANTMGTDKLNLESAIALSGKRRVVKLPANF